MVKKLAVNFQAAVFVSSTVTLPLVYCTYSLWSSENTGFGNWVHIK